MSLAVLQLLERGEELTPALIEDFLARHGSPLVEGSSVTFFWRGEADQVRLRHFVYGLATAQRFTRLDGTDLWYLSFEVPRNSRFEYKIEVVREGRRALLRDPLNPRIARDPFGANSVCATLGYETPEWTLPDPESRPGTLDALEAPSRLHAGPQRLTVYRPARFKSSRRYRLLIVFDGDDYLRFAGLKTVLDNLIHRYEVPPLVVVFSQSPERMGDYAANPEHAEWVAQELLPFLESKLPLRGRPADRCLMGASLGAVASLSAAWRYPGRFGRLLLQSGSFAFSDYGEDAQDARMQPVMEFVNQLREAPGRFTERAFLSCGIYESLIYHNRSLVPRLAEAGMDVRFVEARDGHNWENWRDRLREGLTWLFPGPIGLVYE